MTHSTSGFRLACLSATLLVGCHSPTSQSPAPQTLIPAPRVVPMPASLIVDAGAPFTLSATTTIVVDAGAEGLRTAELFARGIRPATGLPLLVTSGPTSPAAATITLRLADRPSLGGEGYELVVTRDSIRLVAGKPAGLFRGVQTLRQLLPFSAESHMKVFQVPWVIPAVTIVDQPRFAWRGAMLDVARHFFTVGEVKQYLDLLALYKLNTLHLHLSDDQGWRIEIKSRPRLTEAGASMQVGGGAGGFYTQADYSDIVRYAAERYITIVPEIDMPGHTNAALVAHPDLACSKRPTAPFTGTDVGWSTFCVEKEETYALIDDIVREISALSPGPYFHMGGDEVEVLTPAQYALFVERVQGIVAKYGKVMVGWEEIHKAKINPGTIVQQWQHDSLAAAVQKGGKLLVSIARRLYLDMKYTSQTELGLKWAGLVDVRDTYDWDPATNMIGVTERDIVGVEAPLWSETVRNITAVEYLAMPRLPAVAEVGWTPQAVRRWDDFRARLAAQAPRWNLLGVNYYRSSQIDWPR